MPVALAPVGLTGMQSADGEIKAARAAEAFGVPFTLSTMSINSIEEVAEATTKPFWFQLYTMKDEDYMRRLIGRAVSAGVNAGINAVGKRAGGKKAARRGQDETQGAPQKAQRTPEEEAERARIREVRQARRARRAAREKS
mgnify:CR=1 FL=1